MDDMNFEFQSRRTAAAKKPLEMVYSLVLFAILFIIMLILSLISVAAQGIHITVENVGIKSAMTAVYAVLAVSMSFTMRINARARFDNLPEVLALKGRLDAYSNIDRTRAQEELAKLQKSKYEERRAEALEYIRTYLPDYAPQPEYHYDRKISRDLNKLIKKYHQIKPYRETIETFLSPVQVDVDIPQDPWEMPKGRAERDRKWFLKKGSRKFLQMFFIVGLAGELVATIVLTEAVVGTLVRIATVIFSCVYSYMKEYTDCKTKDVLRYTKSEDRLKDIAARIGYTPPEKRL